MSDSGLCRQVVLVQRSTHITEVVHGSAHSGLCRQVVLVQRCFGITEVAHRLAHSGLCRQVMFVTGITVLSCLHLLF